MNLKSLKTGAVTFLGASLLAGFPLSAEAEIPLFIFAGQSNMEGYATNAAELVGTPYGGAQTKVSFWAFNPSSNAYAWRTMQAPTEPSNRFGPEVSAGKDIADTLGYPRVAVVKHAVGATGLAPSLVEQDWYPYSYELALQLLTRVQDAAAVMPTQLGASGKASAFFWMQGETDGNSSDAAVNYQTRLGEFITLARVAYQQPNMPFIMGQVNPSTYAPYWYTVQAAQVAVARADHPRTVLVLTDDLARHWDDLHYNSAGTVELGKRFAHAYRQLTLGSTGLLVNSGFEAQRISTTVGIPSALNGGSTVTGALQGWSDYNAGVTLVRTGALGAGTAQAGEGNQWLSLKNGWYNGGNWISGGVTQTFATVPNATYRVQYSYAALSPGNGAQSSFWVGVNGYSMAAHTVSTAGTLQNRMTPWQTHTFTFVASGYSTALGFASSDVPDGSFYGAGIDNVRVTRLY